MRFAGSTAVLDRLAAAHDPAGEVGRADIGRDPDVAPDADAARDDRALADDRDPGVEPAGLLLVRAVVVRPLADDRALADDDLLVEDRPVDDRAGADDRVEHDDRVAHDRADVDPHAGRQDGVDDRPGDLAAVADQALVDLRRRPDLAGARSSDRVWMTQSLSYRSRSGSSSSRRMFASQNDWIVPTSCQ